MNDLVTYFGKGHLWDLVFLGVLGVVALAIKLMDWFGPRGGTGRVIRPVPLVDSDLLEDVAGLAFDPQGKLVIAGGETNRILLFAAGKLAIHAGDGEEDSADGPATEARFDGPGDVAVDVDGNIYVAEGGSDRIRAIRGIGYIFVVPPDSAAR